MSALSCRPVQPVPLTGPEAHARALLARHGAALPLDLGAAWFATLVPQPLGAAAPASPSGWSLVAEWGGARFVLRLAEPALVRLVEARLPGLELPALPEELAAAALESAWSGVASVLARQRHGNPRLLQTTRRHEAAPLLQHRLAVVLEHPARGERLEAELCTDAAGLLLAAGALRQRAPMPAEAMDGQPMHLLLTIGRTLLAADRMAALRRHDIVLFDQVLWHTRDDGAAVLPLAAGPGQGMRVALRGLQLEVTALWKDPGMLDDIDTPAPAGAAHELAALDAVPVALSFDLGGLTLPLGELRRVAVGQVFDLGRPLGGAVRVRANGALVGEGELVEIDGRLGVSLTRLAGVASP